MLSLLTNIFCNIFLLISRCLFAYFRHLVIFFLLVSVYDIKKKNKDKHTEMEYLKFVFTMFHIFKRKAFLGYFKRNTSNRSWNYSCFVFLLFYKHLFLPEVQDAAQLLKNSCFEKITVCVIEAILVMLAVVQINKPRKEVNQMSNRMYVVDNCSVLLFK